MSGIRKLSTQQEVYKELDIMISNEEIQAKAEELYFREALMPIQLGVAMAEWMQEKCDEEYLEVVQQKEELAKIMYKNRASFDQEKERLQAEIDILHNDVCELESANTQKALEIGFLKEKIKKIRKSDDKVIRRVQKSSLAFFDALHEEVIKKAWNIIYNKNGAITYSEFVKEMKGE